MARKTANKGKNENKTVLPSCRCPRRLSFFLKRFFFAAGVALPFLVYGTSSFFSIPCLRFQQKPVFQWPIKS